MAQRRVYLSMAEKIPRVIYEYGPKSFARLKITVGEQVSLFLPPRSSRAFFSSNSVLLFSINPSWAPAPAPAPAPHYSLTLVIVADPQYFEIFAFRFFFRPWQAVCAGIFKTVEDPTHNQTNSGYLFKSTGNSQARG